VADALVPLVETEPPRRRRPRLEQLEGRCLLAASLASYGQLPLSFEANHGQTAPQVNYLARGPGYGLFLTPTEAVLSLLQPRAPATALGQAPAGDVLRLQLVGANPAPAVQGLDPRPAPATTCSATTPASGTPASPTTAASNTRTSTRA
jgi:hypothetical protein